MLNKKEQYNNFFAKSKEHAYGKPAKIVQMIPDYVRTGSVVDLGAGDGRNAIFLAQKGLRVKAIDTSTVALNKLNDLAKAQNLDVETTVEDLLNWSFDRDYDAVVAISIFQHLPTDQALRLLNEMKARTNPGGINSIALFTNNGDRYRLDLEEDPHAFYPPDGWLKDHYKDWEILSYEESELPLMNKKKEDGTPMTNMMSRIVARKPSAV